MGRVIIFLLINKMMEKESDNLSPLDELLFTKLEIPSLAARIVRRHRLTKLVQMRIERQVTLITAPAGYGKTTLLLDWLSILPPAETRTAWVTLDLFDNTPMRFWSYVTAALRKACPVLRFNPENLLQRGYDPQDFTRLTPLFNEIAQAPYQICLILDDYHAITNENIHLALSYLINHQPRNLYLVLASRVAPPLPLSRLRTLNRLVELNEDDLSFNLQETRKYLSEVMNLEADTDQVAFMLQTTEGWIAGLQMTALSLRNRPFQQPSLNGILNDRSAIPDYFIEEVLGQQDAQTQDFLLKTSILTELSAPLCNAVLGISESAMFLNKLENARLFLTPIGGPQVWYRYHPLFAGALAVQLMKKYPGLLPELHAKAYTWLLENGYPDRAVSHALAAGDLEKAAEIIDMCAMQAIIDFDVTRLLHWIDSISEEFLNRRPSLGIYSALAYFLLGQLEQVEPIMQMAENALNTMMKERISPEKEEILRWEMDAIRATKECFTGQYVQGIPHVKELMKNEKMESVYVYGLLNHAMGIAYEVQGDLDSAIEAYKSGKRVGKKHHFRYGVLHSIVALARLYKLQGRLQDAKNEYNDGLDFAFQNHLDRAAVSLAQTGLLEIALEQNDTPAADRLAQEVFANLDLVEVSASYRMNHDLRCLQLAKYALYYQDIQRARGFFREALKVVRDSQVSQKPSPEIMDVYVHIWLALAKDEPDVIQLEEVESILSPNGSAAMPEQTARARIALAQGHPERALDILNDLIIENRGSPFVENYFNALILQAIAFQSAQQPEQALRALDEALRLGEKERYVRIFVDEGEPMKALLSDYADAWKGDPADAEQSRLTNYARDLLSAFEPRATGSPLPLVQAEPRVTNVFPIQEPLSPRELQVLKMLVEGKSIKAIAGELTISINTAKTHVKSVYRKAGVHTRTLLARRAEELGIQ